MPKSQLLTLTAAVLTTVADIDPEPAPEGPIYAHLMAHGLGLAEWEEIRDLLIRCGHVTRGFAPHTLRITPEGARVARMLTMAAERHAAAEHLGVALACRPPDAAPPAGHADGDHGTPPISARATARAAQAEMDEEDEEAARSAAQAAEEQIEADARESEREQAQAEAAEAAESLAGRPRRGAPAPRLPAAASAPALSPAKIPAAAWLHPATIRAIRAAGARAVGAVAAACGSNGSSSWSRSGVEQAAQWLVAGDRRAAIARPWPMLAARLRKALDLTPRFAPGAMLDANKVPR